jgi:hypothetical protein
MTLLLDPNDRLHNIRIEFKYELTKQFLGTKSIVGFAGGP